jgi:hypothetical protein
MVILRMVVIMIVVMLMHANWNLSSKARRIPLLVAC